MPIRAIGTEFTVNSTLDGDQAWSRTFALQGGDFIAFWVSGDKIDPEDDYWTQEHSWIGRARVFTADGTPQGDDFVFFEGYDLPTATAVERLNNGGYIVLWGSGSYGDSPINVGARFLDAQGRPGSTEVLYSDFGTHGSLTRLTDDRFVVTWTTWDEIRACFLDKDGNRTGEDFLVNLKDTGNEIDPQTVALPNGRFFVAWQSDIDLWEETPLDPDGISIIGRVFEPDGTPVGDDFTINTTPTLVTDSQDHSVKIQADGSILVTWQSNDNQGSRDELMGRIFDNRGTPIGDEFRVPTENNIRSEINWPDLTELADGRTLVTWSIYDDDVSGLHAQLRNSSGKAISDEFVIGTEKYGNVGSLSDGRIVVTWSTGDQFNPGQGVEGDIVAQIFNPKIFDGTDGDDFWTGGAFNDRLNGGDGNDRLRGMEGEDRLRGGNGDDFLDGSEGDDFIWGDAGNDILAGWTGIDTMRGGTGNDTYVVDRLADVVEERAGEGIDTVQSYISLRLGAHVENLLLKGRGDTAATGNGLANGLWGNAGDNLLRSGAGADKLEGGRGDDRLIAGSGSDRLIGGEGADVLAGGTGRDRFIFLGLADSGTGRARDRITDLARGIDKVDLRKIDADTTHAGDQAFHFLGAAAFTGHAGDLRFATGLLAGDVNGDGLADFAITVSGVARLGASDILL
ncbi:MAG TPA: calcium-binding protein [Amaricoccus sp.]|uniref:calcium-binding protein n=1 Tax=Amaricoccus sp. TaxID=1872485 RepID=UPI002C30D6C6|nr:calcium-binding protein [Amaricoccus sp.]HMQ95118.1 calcium-binding protein [Amaricoccus sp.]HMR54566.1 calcium-binding protein [Amaricoccus sp.]HMR61374.1 calcium-binding protein [Amaricoccus sp.]HMU01620.1 calcium-binding protein [Amaricoccus sp.]